MITSFGRHLDHSSNLHILTSNVLHQRADGNHAITRFCCTHKRKFKPLVPACFQGFSEAQTATAHWAMIASWTQNLLYVKLHAAYHSRSGKKLMCLCGTHWRANLQLRSPNIMSRTWTCWSYKKELAVKWPLKTQTHPHTHTHANFSKV